MISAGGIFSNRADAMVRATLSIRISGDCKCFTIVNREDAGTEDGYLHMIETVN